MRTAYYPGCSSHSTGRDYDESARAVCRHLGISLEKIRDWNCCGASAAHAVDRTLAVGLGARNLALAEKMGVETLTTPCAGCFCRLKTAEQELRESAAVRLDVESRLEELPVGRVKVLHLLQLMVDRIGLERLGTEVKRPLTGARVAAYYGCLLTRPSAVMQFDDPEQPISMDRLLRTLGADTVEWSHKAECCGGTYAASETDIALELGAEVLSAAREAGADALVVACPLCGSNLDTRQEAIAARVGEGLDLPVLYFTQAMGLAFGLRSRSLGLRRLLTDPFPKLRAWGFP